MQQCTLPHPCDHIDESATARVGARHLPLRRPANRHPSNSELRHSCPKSCSPSPPAPSKPPHLEARSIRTFLDLACRYIITHSRTGCVHEHNTVPTGTEGIQGLSTTLR